MLSKAHPTSDPPPHPPPLLTGEARALLPPSKIKVCAAHAGPFQPPVLWKAQWPWRTRLWMIIRNNNWWTAAHILSMAAKAAAAHGLNGQWSTSRTLELCWTRSTLILASKTSARAPPQPLRFWTTRRPGPCYPTTPKLWNKPSPPWVHCPSPSTPTSGSSTSAVFSMTAMMLKLIIRFYLWGTKRMALGLWRTPGVMPGANRDISGLPIREVPVWSRIMSLFPIWQRLDFVN